MAMHDLVVKYVIIVASVKQYWLILNIVNGIPRKNSNDKIVYTRSSSIVIICTMPTRHYP